MKIFVHFVLTSITSVVVGTNPVVADAEAVVETGAVVDDTGVVVGTSTSGGRVDPEQGVPLHRSRLPVQ